LKSLSDTDIQKPLAIIAHTIKGYGVKDMENNPAWHHAIPSETQYLKFAGELS
jgi:transketolase